MAATRIGHDAERVAALQELGLLDDELEDRFDSFLSMIADFFAMRQAAIAIADDADLIVKASVGLDGAARIPLEGSFTEAALISGSCVVVEDGSTDPAFRDHPTVVAAPFLRSFAVSPLHGSGGELIGVFALADPVPRTFSPNDLARIGRIVEWIENELTAERESRRARDVQRALQPSVRLQVPGYDIDGVLRASQDVGGDFYDWRGDDSGAVVSLGDVMGKGTGPALLAATIRGALKTSGLVHRRPGAAEGVVDALDLDAGPGDALAVQLGIAAAALDEEFADASAFSTLFHAHLEPSSGMVSYIDAGHGLGSVIAPDGAVTRLRANNQPFGLNPAGSWVVDRVALRPGDTLMIVSDGLLELSDGTLDTLDVDLRSLFDAPSLDAAVQTLIRDRTDRPTPPDDVCVVRIRRHPA